MPIFNIIKILEYGNKIKEIKPSNYYADDDDGVGVVYKYDNRDRLVEVIDEDLNVVKKYKYNEIGQVVEETDVNGNTTYSRYNKAGLLLVKYRPKTVKKSGETLYNYEEYCYNKNWQVIEEKKSNEYVLLDKKTAKFNVIKYSYNELNVVTKVSYSTGASYTRSIDKFGNIELEKKVINKKCTKAEEQVPNEFKCYEQQFDNARHLYYLRARYYNPTVGRFTQDDVYRGDGLNQYAYVKNNPILLCGWILVGIVVIVIVRILIQIG